MLVVLVITMLSGDVVAVESPGLDLAERRRTLRADRATIAANTRFNWWPKTGTPT